MPLRAPEPVLLLQKLQKLVAVAGGHVVLDTRMTLGSVGIFVDAVLRGSSRTAKDGTATSSLALEHNYRGSVITGVCRKSADRTSSGRPLRAGARNGDFQSTVDEQVDGYR